MALIGQQRTLYRSRVQLNLLNQNTCMRRSNAQTLMAGIAMISLVGLACSWGAWKDFGSVALMGIFAAYFTWAYTQELEYVSFGAASGSAKRGSNTRPIVFVLAALCVLGLLYRVALGLIKVWELSA
ncbi:hypothetical protein [Calothrix sp. FACHB-1219]|uniref:hypothetical protein n=2 Tax=Calothrix sp. FACHB-1219 TaxID=2692778 RepID=UPI0030D6D3E4